MSTITGIISLIVGTYTNAGSVGVYSFSFDQENGKSIYCDEVKVNNPSYLTFAPDGNWVYSVSETAGDNAVVSAFKLNKESGQLSATNSKKIGDDGPCYISTDGKYLFIANYDRGSISIFTLNSDGTIGNNCYFEKFGDTSINELRQTSSHLHCIVVAPDDEYLFATNLGGDCIYSYKKCNENGVASFVKQNKIMVNKGSGPRHLTFSPNGNAAYLITEISGEVIAYSYNQGILTHLQTVKIDPNNAMGSGDIHVSPDGKHLYASNRLKGDGIAIFEILQSGMIKEIAYQPTGIHPRNFAITPNGKYVLVACRDDNKIEVYERDITTGLLRNTNKDIELSKPVCIKFAL